MPIANEFSFLAITHIKEPLELVVGRAKRCLTSSSPGRYRFESRELDWRTIYCSHPQRGGANPMRAALWTPRTSPNTCAFFPDSSDGWSNFVGCLARDGMGESLSIRSTNHEGQCRIQEVDYRLPGAEMTRYIRMMDDPGLKYYHLGPPLEFEVKILKKPNKILSRDEVFSFARCVGVDFEDDSYWSSPAPATYITELRNVERA